MPAISTASILYLFFLHRTKKKSDIATYQSKKLGGRKFLRRGEQTSFRIHSIYRWRSPTAFYSKSQLPPNSWFISWILWHVELARSTLSHYLIHHEVKILIINLPAVHTNSNFQKNIRMWKGILTASLQNASDASTPQARKWVSPLHSSLELKAKGSRGGVWWEKFV